MLLQPAKASAKAASRSVRDGRTPLGTGRATDPPSKETPGLLAPFVAIVAVIALIVAIAAFLRAGRKDA